MIPLEFKEFFPAGKDDGHLGLVKVKWNGIILIYKIAVNKKTNIPFAAASSYKTIDPITGEEKFLQAFSIDSRDEDDKVKAFALSHGKAQLKMTSIQNPNTNSWVTQAPPMQYPNQPQPTQENLPF
jgi:hypothetical protein